MLFFSLSIPDVMVIESPLYEDERGSFFVPYNTEVFNAGIGKAVSFIQDNESFSKKGVLRGLHYQIENPQGKLVRVLQGCVYDVAVDLRRNSPFFGRWVGEILSSENRKSLWIPEGFAHGFLVLSESAVFLYKVTASWSPLHECCIQFDDPDLGIAWPHEQTSILVSPRDRQGKLFKEAQVFDE